MKREEAIDYHVKTCWHGLSRMYNELASNYELSMPIGYVLLNIDKNGTPSTKIAPMLGMGTHSLSRLLKVLEDRKWIYKESQNLDKRVVKIFLTEEGKKKRDVARKAVLLFNEKIRQTIGETDLKVFLKTIQRINKSIEDISMKVKKQELALLLEN